MSQDPLQALYSGIGGALLLHLTTIESIYPTVCVCVLTMCLFFRDHFLVNFSEAPIRGVLRAGSGDVFHPKTSVNADKWCKSEAYRFCHWTEKTRRDCFITRWDGLSPVLMPGIVLLG